MSSNQKELFKTPKPETGSRPVTIELRGLGPVPSFKTGKKAMAWIDKSTAVYQAFQGELWVRKRGLRLMARPLTLPEHQKWMERAISLIASQLSSAIATEEEEMRTGLLAHCSTPWSTRLAELDDAWTHIPNITVRCELVEPGKEGASLVLEPLS